MNEDELREVKANALRDAAEGFRRTAASGVEPELNRLLADLLDARATRVEAGEDDHSRVDGLE
ncbi:hypothetical protein [Microbacterium sp.]|uniref:hypothetical protein n=1 Tax=Microbacterium sp. TaxID=51671 RepID=UPI002FE0FAB1